MRFGKSVGLSEDKIYFLVKNNPVTHLEVLATIQDMLHYVLGEVTDLLTIWINSKVPMDTGALRNDLISSLTLSKVNEGLMHLNLGTTLHYADKVSGMTTDQVRHFIDPEAIGNFWMELQSYAEEISMEILQRSIDEYFGGIGKLMGMVRGNV